jgi:hypothetical protein
MMKQYQKDGKLQERGSDNSGGETAQSITPEEERRFRMTPKQDLLPNVNHLIPDSTFTRGRLFYDSSQALNNEDRSTVLSILYFCIFRDEGWSKILNKDLLTNRSKLVCILEENPHLMHLVDKCLEQNDFQELFNCPCKTALLYQNYNTDRFP